MPESQEQPTTNHTKKNRFQSSAPTKGKKRSLNDEDDDMIEKAMSMMSTDTFDTFGQFIADEMRQIEDELTRKKIKRDIMSILLNSSSTDSQLQQPQQTQQPPPSSISQPISSSATYSIPNHPFNYSSINSAHMQQSNYSYTPVQYSNYPPVYSQPSIPPTNNVQFRENAHFNASYQNNSMSNEVHRNAEPTIEHRNLNDASKENNQLTSNQTHAESLVNPIAIQNELQSYTIL